MKNNITSLRELDIPKGYRAYNLKGVSHTIIAKKGGPTADQIKSRPSYQELRNNQKEFGIASMMAKALRDSLSAGMSEICETYTSGRLTAKFRNLAKLEEGETGTRPLFLSKHGHLLNGFEFNTEAPYDKIFGANYHIKSGSRRGQVIIHIPSFIPEKTFSCPATATNFKLSARLVALSDYKYDSSENAYFAAHKEFHGCYGTFESPMLPLLKIPIDPMTAMVGLGNPNVPENMGLVLIMAISFYHYEDGKFQHLPKGSGMTIKTVY